MAYFSFTKRIIEGKPIRVFNYGNMERDFTYIDDVVQGVCKLLERAPSPNPFGTKLMIQLVPVLLHTRFTTSETINRSP